LRKVFESSIHPPSLELGLNLILQFVLICVDDIIITDTFATDIQSRISMLQQHFALKELGSLHFFLGLEAS